MRGPQSTINGGTTNAVAEEHGPGLNGFTNGDASTYDPEMDVNGNGTEVCEQWFDDVTTNLKLACREGNGVDGPASDDANDDPMELADAVNTAANVLTGTASFVSSGLRFTTSGANLNVTLTAGLYCYQGRKHHATATMLSNFTVQVDGSDAGSGDAFTLLASRDHYISVGPTTSLTSYDGSTTYSSPQRRVSIQVRDVANGATAPSVPGGHFVFAMLATDGTGVTSETYYGDGPRLASSDGSRLVLRPSPDGPGVPHVPASVHPLAGTGINLDIGYDTEDSDEGRFNGAYIRSLDIRTNASTDYTHARNLRYTVNSSVSGGGTANVEILDAADPALPDGTAVYLSAKGVAIDPADPTDSYIFRTEGLAYRDSGTWQFTGGGPAFEGAAGALAASMGVAHTVSGDLLRITLTGHTTDDTRWFFEVHYVMNGD